MTAYVIADIDIHDQDTYREYSALVPDTLRPYGGRFLVRGGAFETLEGDWRPRRVVVLEFPALGTPGAGTGRRSTPRRWRCATVPRPADSCWSREPHSTVAGV